MTAQQLMMKLLAAVERLLRTLADYLLNIGDREEEVSMDRPPKDWIERVRRAGVTATSRGSTPDTVRPYPRRPAPAKPQTAKESAPESLFTDDSRDETTDGIDPVHFQKTPPRKRPVP